MRLRPFHLAIALDDAGWHPSTIDVPAVESPGPAVRWAQIIPDTDHPSIAFVTIADSYRVVGDGRPARLDALLVACAVAALTRTVGIVPQVTTSITEPFLVSSQVATLDHISGGRAGCGIEVSLRPDDAGYVGPRPVAAVDERYAEAAEYVEVVRRLWDSWEDGAEIRDAAAQRFIDAERIHHIDYAGDHLTVSGPSITPRPPQGQPVIAVDAHDGPSERFAAAHADVAFLRARTPAELARRLTAVGGLTTATGEVMVGPLRYADVLVFLDDTQTAARRRRERLPRPDWPGLAFTGTPEQCASWLQELAELGCDGVRLHPAAIPHDLDAITGQLTALLPVPAHEDDDGAPAPTLRGRLGLTQTPSRYAVLA